MHRKVAKRTFQVNQELKNPDTGEVVTPPVDDVTKYGPVDGDPITSTEE
ncbi:E domain-containing protein, partial [Staphylococcus epidermidis]